MKSVNNQVLLQHNKISIVKKEMYGKVQKVQSCLLKPVMLSNTIDAKRRAKKNSREEQDCQTVDTFVAFSIFCSIKIKPEL